MAQCIARAPGGPTHVLLDDRIAEHVPGCNMAFRREALLAIGGFNPIYLRAGDDVDVCWRLQARGWRDRVRVAGAGLASPPVVDQRRTGGSRSATARARRWLMAHHPEKFLDGHMLWRGRIYSPLPFVRSLWGTNGSTPVSGAPRRFRRSTAPTCIRSRSCRTRSAGRSFRSCSRWRAGRSPSAAITTGRRRCCSAAASSASPSTIAKNLAYAHAIGRRFAPRQQAVVPRDGRVPPFHSAVRAAARADSRACFRRRRSRFRAVEPQTSRGPRPSLARGRGARCCCSAGTRHGGPLLERNLDVGRARAVASSPTGCGDRARSARSRSTKAGPTIATSASSSAAGPGSTPGRSSRITAAARRCCASARTCGRPASASSARSRSAPALLVAGDRRAVAPLAAGRRDHRGLTLLAHRARGLAHGAGDGDRPAGRRRASTVDQGMVAMPSGPARAPLSPRRCCASTACAARRSSSS